MGTKGTKFLDDSKSKQSNRERNNEKNEFEKRLIQTLNKLQGEVENGKLPLSRIAEENNGMLPERLRIKDNKNIGAILRRLNLTTKQSTGGFYFLLWEDEKIKNLLRDTSTMSTMSTMSTTSLVEPGIVNNADEQQNFEELCEFFEQKRIENN